MVILCCRRTRAPQMLRPEFKPYGLRVSTPDQSYGICMLQSCWCNSRPKSFVIVLGAQVLSYMTLTHSLPNNAIIMGTLAYSDAGNHYYTNHRSSIIGRLNVPYYHPITLAKFG